MRQRMISVSLAAPTVSPGIGIRFRCDIEPQSVLIVDRHHRFGLTLPRSYELKAAKRHRPPL